MEHLLTLQYYLAPIPESDFQFSKISLFLGIMLILLSIGLEFYRKKHIKDAITKKILRAYPSKLRFYGFMLLMLLGFRELGIPFLSMRLWWFLLLAFFIYRILKFSLTYKKKYAKRHERVLKNHKNDKYIPKKK